MKAENADRHRETIKSRFEEKLNTILLTLPDPYFTAFTDGLPGPENAHDHILAIGEAQMRAYDIVFNLTYDRPFPENEFGPEFTAPTLDEAERNYANLQRTFKTVVRHYAELHDAELPLHRYTPRTGRPRKTTTPTPADTETPTRTRRGTPDPAATIDGLEPGTEITEAQVRTYLAPYRAAVHRAERRLAQLEARGKAPVTLTAAEALIDDLSARKARATREAADTKISPQKRSEAQKQLTYLKGFLAEIRHTVKYAPDRTAITLPRWEQRLTDTEARALRKARERRRTTKDTLTRLEQAFDRDFAARGTYHLPTPDGKLPRQRTPSSRLREGGFALELRRTGQGLGELVQIRNKATAALLLWPAHEVDIDLAQPIYTRTNPDPTTRPDPGEPYLAVQCTNHKIELLPYFRADIPYRDFEPHLKAATAAYEAAGKIKGDLDRLYLPQALAALDHDCLLRHLIRLPRTHRWLMPARLLPRLLDTLDTAHFPLRVLQADAFLAFTQPTPPTHRINRKKKLTLPALVPDGWDLPLTKNGQPSFAGADGPAIDKAIDRKLVTVLRQPHPEDAEKHAAEVERHATNTANKRAKTNPGLAEKLGLTTPTPHSKPTDHRAPRKPRPKTTLPPIASDDPKLLPILQAAEARRAAETHTPDTDNQEQPA